jgi:hypothetical protein
MLKQLVLAAVLAGAISIQPEAMAQAGFTPSPGLGGLKLDLDTESGNASRFEISQVCEINAIRTTLSVPRLGSNARWLPSTTINLSGSDLSVGVQIGGTRSQPLPIRIRTYGKDQDTAAVLKRQLKVSETVDIAIDWTPGGDVRIRIGDEEATVRVPGGVKAISFGNSTGEALFSPLSIGRTPAPVAGCPIS